MHLLGGIDEEEEQRERACCRCGERKRQGLDALEELLEIGSTPFLASPRTRGATKRLDGLERLVSLESPDDATEGGREATDVLVQGKIDFARLLNTHRLGVTVRLFAPGHSCDSWRGKMR